MRAPLTRVPSGGCARYGDTVAAVTLTVVANEMEAEVICGSLRANGIECDYRKTNVAAVDFLPFSGSTSIVNFTIEHHVVADATAKPRAALRAVSSGYFDVLSIPPVDGRRFISGDESPETSIAIVNEAFVRQYVPGETYAHRIKVRGVVTLQQPGRALYLRDETGGLYVQTQEGYIGWAFSAYVCR